MEKRVSTFLAEVASICSLSRSPSIESLRSEASTQPYVLAGKWTNTARLQSQSAHWEQILQLSDSRPEATRHRRPTRLSEVIEEVKAKTVLDPRSTRFRKDPPSRTAIRTPREIMQSRQQRLSQQEKSQTPNPPPEPSPRTPSQDSNIAFPPISFERWNHLSDCWEGLTRYWVRRLEQYRNDPDFDSLPITMQLSQQVTDLSATGANLFHAVIQLQRLRASSERKFQRWVFETRNERETWQKKIKNLENSLAKEHNTVQILQLDRDRIDSSLRELQFEFVIKKEEATQAWEELGRKEQEHRDLKMREQDEMVRLNATVKDLKEELKRLGSLDKTVKQLEEELKNERQQRTNVIQYLTGRKIELVSTSGHD